MKRSNPSSSINRCGLLSILAVLPVLSETVLRAATALIFCFAAGSIEPARAAESAANVDAARLVGADQDPANWMTYGRTYSEQRFSPLAQITADNANLLGLAWYADFDVDRGQEATPLIITMGTVLYAGIARMACAISIPSIIGII